MKSNLKKLFKSRALTFIVSLLLSQLSILSQNSWLPLTQGVTGSNFNIFSRVHTMIVWNNKLIVGGSFKSAGGNLDDNIAIWDGNAWSSFSNGLIGNQISGCTQSIFGGVRALQVYQGDLIAAGDITSSGSNTFVAMAKWTGSAWQGIVNKLISNISIPKIHSLIIYNNELIAAGVFDTINNVAAKNIAKWNGTSWSPLGTGIPTNQVALFQVNALEIHNNELYVGGNFTCTVGSQTANNIIKWNGVNWSTLGNGFSPCFFGSTCYTGGVSCLKSFQGNLYAGNCVSGISRWNGTSWSNVGGGMPFGGQIYSMHIFDNKLIIAGSFQYVGLDNSIFFGSVAAWNGSSWLPLGNDTGQDLIFGIGEEAVYSLSTFNNELYLGGAFLQAQSNQPFPQVFLNNITKLAGTTIDLKEYSKKSNISIIPNPSNGKYNLKSHYENNSVEITDLTGRLILSKKTQEKEMSFSLENQSPGVYLYTVKNQDGVLQRGKLILEK